MTDGTTTDTNLSYSQPQVLHFRLKWPPKDVAVQKYAEMLNHRGGTLEIAHESVYADLPAPLALPSDSRFRFDKDHFHLDVITELSTLNVWSNAEIKFVLEGTTVYQSHFYRHYVYYTASPGCVTLRLEPLPTPYMAALSNQPPHHRQGDQKHPLPFAEWFGHLLQVNDISLRCSGEIQLRSRHYVPCGIGWNRLEVSC